VQTWDVASLVAPYPLRFKNPNRQVVLERPYLMAWPLFDTISAQDGLYVDDALWGLVAMDFE